MKRLIDGFLGYFRIEHALLLIPCCGISIFDSVFSAFSSILAVLGELYPDVPTTVIQLILTMPQAMCVPAGIVAGILASYVRKKHIAEFALVLILIGGMIPVAFHNPTIQLMFLCGGLIGAGQGLLMPMTNAFICELWQKDGERSKALGFNKAFGYIGTSIVALVVGYLALRYWGNGFLVYLTVIPVIILVHLLFPRGELETKLVSTESKIAGLKSLLNLRMIYLCCVFFVGGICLFGFHSNIAMLVSEKGLGNTADIAKITSTLNIMSLVVAVLYGKLSAKLGRFTLIAAFLLAALGNFVALSGGSLFVLILGGALFGIGAAMQEVSTIYYVSLSVDKKQVTIAISL
ncbi:MAG: MFS transporter, partial [Eggerthellaceae bacterium]|nr:MFS transporter [Eggerthellaceae bacterium]